MTRYDIFRFNLINPLHCTTADTANSQLSSLSSLSLPFLIFPTMSLILDSCESTFNLKAFAFASTDLKSLDVGGHGADGIDK